MHCSRQVINGEEDPSDSAAVVQALESEIASPSQDASVIPTEGTHTHMGTERRGDARIKPFNLAKENAKAKMDVEV